MLKFIFIRWLSAYQTFIGLYWDNISIVMQSFLYATTKRYWHFLKTFHNHSFSCKVHGKGLRSLFNANSEICELKYCVNVKLQNHPNVTIVYHWVQRHGFYVNLKWWMAYLLLFFQVLHFKFFNNNGKVKHIQWSAKLSASVAEL